MQQKKTNKETNTNKGTRWKNGPTTKRQNNTREIHMRKLKKHTHSLSLYLFKKSVYVSKRVTVERFHLRGDFLPKTAAQLGACFFGLKYFRTSLGSTHGRRSDRRSNS